MQTYSSCSIDWFHTSAHSVTWKKHILIKKISTTNRFKHSKSLQHDAMQRCIGLQVSLLVIWNDENTRKVDWDVLLVQWCPLLQLQMSAMLQMLQKSHANAWDLSHLVRDVMWSILSPFYLKCRHNIRLKKKKRMLYCTKTPTQQPLHTEFIFLTINAAHSESVWYLFFLICS